MGKKQRSNQQLLLDCPKESQKDESFSDSWESDSWDNSLDSDIVTDYVENLQLNGEDVLQIVDIDQYTRELGHNLETSQTILDHQEGFSSAIDEESGNSDLDMLANSASQHHEDIVNSVEVIQKMTDEEALEYIQYLKQKIRKIKQVLKTRSEKYPLSEDTMSDDCPSEDTDLSKDDKSMVGRRTRRAVVGSSAKNNNRKPTWRRIPNKRPKTTAPARKNKKRYNKQFLDTLETMDGLDWSQFPISGNGIRKHLNKLYSKMIDDEFRYAMNLTSFKKKRRGLYKSPFQLRKRSSALQLFHQIRQFLQKSSSEKFTFPAMNRHMRLVIHKFAEVCGITSESHGKEGRRSVTIYRAPCWKLPRDETIQEILSQVGLGKDTKKTNKKQKKAATFSMPTASTYSVRGRKELERSLAVDIGEDNIGHRMLQSMGWSKGQSLGHPNREEAGLKQPVQVRIRPPRAGLGSEQSEKSQNE